MRVMNPGQRAVVLADGRRVFPGAESAVAAELLPAGALDSGRLVAVTEPPAAATSEPEPKPEPDGSPRPHRRTSGVRNRTATEE